MQSHLYYMINQLLNNGHQHLLSLLALLLLVVYPLHTIFIYSLEGLDNLYLSFLSCLNVVLKYFFELFELLCELPIDSLLEFSSRSSECNNFISNSGYFCFQAAHLLKQVILNKSENTLSLTRLSSYFLSFLMRTSSFSYNFFSLSVNPF